MQSVTLSLSSIIPCVLEQPTDSDHPSVRCFEIHRHTGADNVVIPRTGCEKKPDVEMRLFFQPKNITVYKLFHNR